MKTIIAACLLTSANSQLASTELKRNRHPAGSEQPSAKKRRTNLRTRNLNVEKPFRLFSPIRVPGKNGTELSTGKADTEMSMSMTMKKSAIGDIEDFRETIVGENIIQSEFDVVAADTTQKSSSSGTVAKSHKAGKESDQSSKAHNENAAAKSAKSVKSIKAAKDGKGTKRRLASASISMSLSPLEEPAFAFRTEDFGTTEDFRTKSSKKLSSSESSERTTRVETKSLDLIVLASANDLVASDKDVGKAEKTKSTKSAKAE
ncbi:hypothetical protein THAOC_05417 [Thalassiosira oceanica]|uniref:Uncharacterized protein n=1 Tax=Thalassiosira oceanica TaxID=159749 RepID=K0T7A1_THAOC|nr:hypothetical protein THAOC_05417 [Thalassiosira oceanica]|eukprot:EJK72989.1 hypothetical protein THAOC_05417 [Thalassiosira oceanica]